MKNDLTLVFYKADCLYLASESHLAGQNTLRQVLAGLVRQELQESEELGQQTQVEDHRACLLTHHDVHWVCQGREFYVVPLYFKLEGEKDDVGARKEKAQALGNINVESKRGDFRPLRLHGDTTIST